VKSNGGSIKAAGKAQSKKKQGMGSSTTKYTANSKGQQDDLEYIKIDFTNGPHHAFDAKLSGVSLRSLFQIAGVDPEVIENAFDVDKFDEYCQSDESSDRVKPKLLSPRLCVCADGAGEVVCDMMRRNTDDTRFGKLRQWSSRCGCPNGSGRSGCDAFMRTAVVIACDIFHNMPTPIDPKRLEH
jgi:hypothetical protein